MKPVEHKVLEFLAANCGDNQCFPFDPIVLATNFDRKSVRRACRSLARRGYAEYARGLINGRGDFAGSGYGCTRLGLAKAYEGQ